MKSVRITTTAELLNAIESARSAATEIIVAPGSYFFDTTIHLDGDFSGLKIKGEDGARFIGGREIGARSVLTDAAVLNRLDESVRGKIYTADLAGQGITEYGSFVSRGFARDISPSHAEVFLGGAPLNLSRYPKEGEFLTITGFGKGTVNECEDEVGIGEYGFKYDDARPEGWQTYKDVWVHGYWCFDWAFTTQQVESIDRQARHIMTRDPYVMYSFRPGQRFFFSNILEELLYPGDYYIDRDAGKLYFYPPAGRENDELFISMMETPIFSAKDADGIAFENISFEAVRGIGLQFSDCTGFKVDNCIFKNIGNYGIKITECRDFRVENCTISNTGDGGMTVACGDRMTLTSCGGVITNNHIHHIGRWAKCYCTAINASGVGLEITHNLIHDTPHIGIIYAGNDFKIEHNEIYSVCLETGDAGAVYSGRDLTCRGNSISHNFIHHMGGVGLGTMGIYNDDGLSGTKMENNFFLEVGRACFMGGGQNFEVKNNVFVKCYPAITVDSRAAHTDFFWHPMYGGLKKSFYDAAQSYTRKNDPGVRLDASKSPYIDRYPELKEVDAMFKENRPMLGSAVISDNVFCAKVLFRYFYDMRDENRKVMYKDGQRVELTPAQLSAVLDSRRDVAMEWSAGKGSWLYQRNFTAAPGDFVDAKWGDINVRPESKAIEYGHKPAGLDSIGLIEENRRVNPPTVRTALSRDVSSGEVTLELRNESGTAVSGELKLYAKEELGLCASTVSFRLDPGEESAAKLGFLNPDEDFYLEVRSATPGVRPSRL